MTFYTIVKKWPVVLKIGVFLTLCLFVFECLHPSGVGVRVCKKTHSEHYTAVNNEFGCRKDGKPGIIANADNGLIAELPLTDSDKINLETDDIVHAMIIRFALSVYWSFPQCKFQTVKEFIHKQFHLKEIYHPPRLFRCFLDN